MSRYKFISMVKYIKLYFAAPLFCDAEREFNEKLTNQIERLGYEVYLPQRANIDLDEKCSREITNHERSKFIFELDKKEMFSSDIFLFVLDGRIPDEGACVALGMCYMHKSLVNNNKLLIGLQTDKRGAYEYSKLNPMIEASMNCIFESVSELLEFLKNKIISE